jgi:hypothetical protein
MPAARINLHRWVSMGGTTIAFFACFCAAAPKAKAQTAPSAPTPGPQPAAPATAPAPAIVQLSPPAPTGGRPSTRVRGRLFLRLALGTVFLHESWSPRSGGLGAVYDGWGTALDTSIGRTLRPGFTVGGRWQFAAVVDANESYQGARYVVTQTARLLDTIAIFVDDFPNPRRGFHFGGSVGVLAASNFDTVYGTVATGWGAAVSSHVGYETFLSNRWSVGVLAGLAAYRYWDSEAGVSSTSDGLMPTLALSFSFE